MIKVNLLKSKSQGSSSGDGRISIKAKEGSDQKKEMLIKVLLMSIFIIGLMLYEKQNIDELKLRWSQATARTNNIQEQVAVLQQELDEYTGIESQARNLEGRVMVIRELSRRRVQVIQALDLLQSIIPERVWLSEVRFNIDRFVLQGRAVSEEDLAEFVRLLEGAAYFQNVILLQAREESTPEGSLRIFEISSRLGGER